MLKNYSTEAPNMSLLLSWTDPVTNLATVGPLCVSEIQPELRPCSSHINRGEALEQSTTLGEGGATRPSMKKSSPTLSGGQKLRP